MILEDNTTFKPSIAMDNRTSDVLKSDFTAERAKIRENPQLTSMPGTGSQLRGICE